MSNEKALEFAAAFIALEDAKALRRRAEQEYAAAAERFQKAKDALMTTPVELSEAA